MGDYDAVFIGSGHNALITAAMLARAGWSVLVLEKNDRPGGFVRTDALTLPGFLHDTYSTAHPLFVTGPAYAALGPDLAERGLRYLNTDIPGGVLTADGRTAVVYSDMAAMTAEADRLAPGDGAAWGSMIQGFAQYAGPVFGLFGMSLGSPEATALIRGLMLSTEGIGLSPFAADFLITARDLLETRFQSDVLRAMVVPWLLHAGRGPDDANSGFWLPLFLMALQSGGVPTPVGGSEQLVRALVRLIEEKGGVVRSQSLVQRVVIDGGAAAGVMLAGGEVIRARRAVVASTNPDQLYLKLLEGSGVVTPSVEKQARGFRYGRGAVQIHLALSEPPAWPDPRLGKGGLVHITSGLDGVSRSVNEAVRGLLPAEPTIAFDVPTALDPARAPEGKAVARLQMLDVPRRARGDAAGVIDVGDGSWTEDLKERFADRVIELASRHVPNLKASILARYTISPADLAAYNPNAGDGDPYGGAHDLAQSYLLRPMAGQPGCRTAVPNLSMVGAATWPGHGVSGGSGYILAQELLQKGAG
jgi:phytoene dehydrogenase-like protein